MRGYRAGTAWALLVGTPGAALSVYCPGSIPSIASFIGEPTRKLTVNSLPANSDSRQLQM
jgi:hypothetical protein